MVEVAAGLHEPGVRVLLGRIGVGEDGREPGGVERAGPGSVEVEVKGIEVAGGGDECNFRYWVLVAVCLEFDSIVA